LPWFLALGSCCSVPLHHSSLPPGLLLFDLALLVLLPTLVLEA
jgi:hypothetical protein